MCAGVGDLFFFNLFFSFFRIFVVCCSETLPSKARLQDPSLFIILMSQAVETDPVNSWPQG